MHIALPIVLLIAAVVAVAAVARRTGLSAPLLLTALGGAASFVPGIPAFEIEPELILLGLLPPLLYAAASQTSLVDLGRDRRQILGLSVGLVLFTAAGVGLVAWQVLSIPFAAALALGGIVAPPDAVAATAVARQIGLPRRVVSVLEGESLFNDATALVIVNTAVGLATATVISAVGGFFWASIGGAAIGFVAFFLIARVRRHITDTVTSVAVSFMTPWLAYLPAEAVHASGVIAVVVCGVLLAHKSPYIQTAQSRVSERMNWSSIQFILENLVFLLIGLQTRTIVENLVHSDRGFVHVLLISILILGVVMLLRPMWIMAWAVFGRMTNARQGSLTPRESGAASWAGMRGVVTLAAAFSLPSDTPARDALVFIALVVTVGTLVIQGFSLGWFARRLGLHAPDPREDALQLAQMVQASVTAGVHQLKQDLDDAPAAVPAPIVDALKAQGTRRANLAWERLGSGLNETSPTAQYRSLRMSMLQAERAKILLLRDKGIMDHEVLSAVMSSLDVEESMLTFITDADEQVRDRLLLTPEGRRGGCDHLRDAAPSADPQSVDTCPDCVREGTQPVHLRMCLTCGYVGCCDSSVPKHSSKHFAQTGHPVMRSFEPGEAWRWCYVDRLLG